MSRVAAALLVFAALAGAAPASEVERTVEVAGVARTYLLHAPPGVSPDAPLPLVVVLHGAGGDAWRIAAQTGFSNEADWRGFAVAYPEGSDGALGRARSRVETSFLTWNAGTCCGWASAHEVDDVGFVRALIADVERELPIDRRRVYAAGMSNGGMMSYRLACEASDVFAAVGVVSGALVAPACAPAEPVAVIHFHGSDDAFVPFEGGPSRFMPKGFPSAASALARFRAADGCEPSPQESTPRPAVRLREYRGCRAGTALELYVLEGGQHTWPGADPLSLAAPAVSPSIAATPLIWQFFASHPKP